MLAVWWDSFDGCVNETIKLSTPNVYVVLRITLKWQRLSQLLRDYDELGAPLNAKSNHEIIQDRQ